MEVFFFDDWWVLVIYEVLVVDWNLYIVKVKWGKEFGVGWGEEIFKELEIRN